MAKIRKQLAKEQIDIFHEMQTAGFNVVTCGNCGTILLHKTNQDSNTIECCGCGEEMELSDCPDFWHTGAEDTGYYED